MKKYKLLIILFIIIVIVFFIGFILFQKNPLVSTDNLKNYETEYSKISMIPSQKAIIKKGEKFYNCFETLFQNTQIVQLTTEQIKNIPIIKSSDNAIILRRDTEQIKLSPIIDLGNEVENITSIISKGNTSYLREFPTIYLETSTIQSNISEAKIPNNLPSGIYKTISGNSSSGLFYYQQENEELSKDLFSIYEQYKQQELELLKYKSLAEKKLNDNFGYLNLLIPKNAEIYQIKNLKITGKHTKTNQEVEANFSYGNINLPSANSDILYYNNELYYSLRVTGGEVLNSKSHWSDTIAVKYETLKQLIETGLSTNIEHNTHKTQKQSNVYNF